MNKEKAVIIINKTRLESLVERFNTRDQARFYIEHSGGNFADYEAEHKTFHVALENVTEMTQQYLNYKIIDRQFVPNYLFGENDVVIVLGQDGLVANAAKYVNQLPILAVNPDAERYDGILLPFGVDNFNKGLKDLMKGNQNQKSVTLAEAKTNDGQRLLAFNDLFIGPVSHTSARYSLTLGAQTEKQSSSGIIVSTGAGSTGWLSSVLNMSNGVQYAFTSKHSSGSAHYSMPWDANELAFVVREPFQSRHSGISLSAGIIHSKENLVIESHMPVNGIIFSDGIEADYIRFNSGTTVQIGIASQKATLVTV